MLFSGRERQSASCQVIERIAKLIRSSRELSDALEGAVGEIGRAFDLPHAAIILRMEGKPAQTFTYFPDAMTYSAKEEMRLLDAEIVCDAGQAISTVELDGKELSLRLTALFSHSLEGPSGELDIKSALISPIKLDETTVGFLLIYLRKRGRRSGNELKLAPMIAATLALAIDRFESEERAKIAAEREALNNRLLNAIRGAIGVDEILKVAVESLAIALRATRSVIYMRSREEAGSGRSITDASCLRARAEYRESVLVPSLLNNAIDMAGSHLFGQLLAGEIITISDTAESSSMIRAIGVKLGVRALALAPISYNGQMVAVLAIEQFDRPRHFNEEEIRLIKLATEQTAVALYQAELYREASEAARRDALLTKISSAIHRSLEPEAVLQAIVNEVGVALSVCRARIALLPNPLPEMIPITNEYVASCCSNKPAALSEIQVRDNTYLKSVLANDAPIVVNDPDMDPRLASVRKRVEAGDVKSIMTIAIRVAGKPIGIFSLHHCERRHTWTEWEIDLVRAVAEQAAVAMRQAELHREVRESALRASLVNQIVASIRRSLDLNEILQVASEEIGRTLKANRAYFRKLVGEENVVVAEYLSDPPLSMRHIPTPLNNYIFNYLSETRRTLVIDDVLAFIAAYPDLAEGVPTWKIKPINLSQIICPIFVNDNFWGALSISQTDRIRKWTASEVSLIEVVAAQVEVAVSHGHLFQEARHAAEREALISHIIHGINQSNQLDEIFPIVATELGEHLQADSLLIFWQDEQTDEWRIECAFGNGKITRPDRRYHGHDFTSFTGLFEEDVVLSDDSENDPRMVPFLDRFLRPVGTRAFMAVRLLFKNQPRLVIAAIMKQGPRHWSNDDVEVIRAVADQVFVALQRAELFEQISHGKHEWEATFDALTDGIFLFDSEGILRRVNEAGAAFEGARIREMIGRRCCTLLQGFEAEECRVQQVLKTGRPVTFEIVPEKLSRPVLVTMSPIKNPTDDETSEANGNNDPLGAVCIVRDLSELKAAEAVAREQRSFLIKLIEHANDAIFAISPEGRLVWFNEQLTKLSGYSRDELMGKGCWHFLVSGEKDVAVDLFYRALAGEAQTFEMQGKKKDGDTRLLLVTYTPIYDEGRITSVLSIARDITEERLASERAAQADKLRALGQLASGVAHNFNNILAAILGHAQLVRRDFKDERLRQRMDIIERAALDGAQTVKRIQAFGLQDNETAQDAIDLNQLVQDSTTLTRARWRDDALARGLHYEVALDLKPVPVVNGSASELREVFVNIILNALDAMPQGGSLHISTEAVGSNTQVIFSDSGIGMAPEVRDHIFEPFFTTKGVTGMGLGLAVSYSIIERHGGRIEARSSPGRGTTFTLTLPSAESSQPKKERNSPLKVKKASVLVIDDDERVRTALVGMLSAAGHRTEQAGSGGEALQKLERDSFELVITDLSMPEMDGWAVASEIRRRWPEVKIVLITGYALSPEALTNHRDLVNEVIFKPIRLDDISATLSQVL